MMLTGKELQAKKKTPKQNKIHTKKTKTKIDKLSETYILQYNSAWVNKMRFHFKKGSYQS